MLKDLGKLAFMLVLYTRQVGSRIDSDSRVLVFLPHTRAALIHNRRDRFHPTLHYMLASFGRIITYIYWETKYRNTLYT